MTESAVLASETRGVDTDGADVMIEVAHETAGTSYGLQANPEACTGWWLCDHREVWEVTVVLVRSGLGLMLSST